MYDKKQLKIMARNLQKEIGDNWMEKLQDFGLIFKITVTNQNSLAIAHKLKPIMESEEWTLLSGFNIALGLINQSYVIIKKDFGERGIDIANEALKKTIENDREGSKQAFEKLLKIEFDELMQTVREEMSHD